MYTQKAEEASLSKIELPKDLGAAIDAYIERLIKAAESAACCSSKERNVFISLLEEGVGVSALENLIK